MSLETIYQDRYEEAMRQYVQAKQELNQAEQRLIEVRVKLSKARDDLYDALDPDVKEYTEYGTVSTPSSAASSTKYDG